jgi:hypothetical protein
MASVAAAKLGRLAHRSVALPRLPPIAGVTISLPASGAAPGAAAARIFRRDVVPLLAYRAPETFLVKVQTAPAAAAGTPSTAAGSATVEVLALDGQTRTFDFAKARAQGEGACHVDTYQPPPPPSPHRSDTCGGGVGGADGAGHGRCHLPGARAS